MWNEYNPLQTDDTVDLPNTIEAIQGDILRNPQNEKNYLIHTINENDESCVVYCYEDKSFAEWDIPEVQSKRKGDNTWPLKAVTLYTGFTAQDDEGVQYGVKVHGSVMQNQQMIEQSGPNIYLPCISWKVAENCKGFEITEPYDPDQAVVGSWDSFTEEFTDEFYQVVTEFDLTERMTEDFTQDVLKSFLYNTDIRVKVPDAYKVDLNDSQKSSLREGEMEFRCDYEKPDTGIEIYN